MPSDAPLEVRQEWARLRQIMYEPSTVWLATDNAGDRWLTDQYVMLCVTGSLALQPLEFTEFFGELKDGAYKLTASNGLQPRDSVPEPDLGKYFGVLEGCIWWDAYPSEWSVAEHPGKAMLWTFSGPCGCLLGEPTWTAIKKHYVDVRVDYSPSRNLFRFRDADGSFCYAAGIRVPEGQENMAAALARQVDSTSN